MRLKRLVVGMPKQKMVDLLYELIKNSKRSDRELAKVVRVSQPTITRMRRNLEKGGYIQEYTLVPALEKLGYEIIAFNFLSASPEHELKKENHAWVSKNPRIFFASSGSGLDGKTLLLVSIHKDYTDYSAFVRELRSALGLEAASMESFLLSLRTDIVKNFSFKNLKQV